MPTTKILIIKLGYSETLDPDIGKVPSLGDVLRTTPILWAIKERFPDSHITWLVTDNAEALLQGNRLIDRILVWDEFVPFQLMREKFDVLINLEKIPGVCALSDMIDAWVKYGFRFETMSGEYRGYEKGLTFISYIKNKKTNVFKGYWQQVLIEMMGVAWTGQTYMVGYEPKTSEQFDIGLNYEVGSKWPVKGMPLQMWRDLENRLTFKGYTVSWQEGKSDLNEYMDWINSCRLIISNDSLGLHLAQAFNKKVIGLFGPTDAGEVYSYGGSRMIVSATQCPVRPCIASHCSSGQHCMNGINLDKVEVTTREFLGEPALSHFPNLIFDFDGVIAETNAIRIQGFKELFGRRYPDDKVEMLLRYARANTGLSRYAKIRHFFEHILKCKFDAALLEQFAADYSAIVKERVIAAPAVPGTEMFLDTWQGRSGCAVISGSDEIELREVCSARGIADYFTAIYGSPPTKKENINRLLEQTGWGAAECLFIGDSHNDLMAAMEFGIKFLARDSGIENWDGYDGMVLNDLTDLESYLKRYWRSHS
jgi:heptosyltransferase-2